MKMEFIKHIRTAEQLLPPDFKRLERQEIEYRQDPLTGSTCIIDTKRAERARQAETTARISDQVARETEKGCPFCPENVLSRTSRFPPDIIPRGLMQRGECHLFPNLFAFAEYHAVATISRAHFLDLDEFTPEIIFDNMVMAREWMLSVHAHNRQASYPVYMWNHLPPSGGSIVHPHVQILMRESPTAMQRLLLEKGRDYWQKNGNNYWKDLVRREWENGERNIDRNDTLTLIASYAPRGFREIQLIFESVASFSDLRNEEIGNFASMLVRLLRAYKAMGVGSFNLITFSAPVGENPEYYSLHAKVISRPFPQGVYTNDTGTMERLQDEWVIETLPEELAQKMRAFF